MKKICLVMLLVSANLFCAELVLPHGQIVERVPCRRNASQTYVLYLPSSYTPGKKWPILYALDPGARGLIPVQRFKEAAEQYGYIVAGSNNARNGPVKIVEDALNALLEDTVTRFSLDPKQAYLAGFSGGARASILAALAAKGRFAGVIAFGAGFPPDIRPARPTPFSLYLAAGIEDFNHPELRELDRVLESAQIPHEFETFSGGHDWPPQQVCTHALEWLELQAMNTGVRDRDPDLIEGIYRKTVEEAESLESSGQLSAATTRYRMAVRSFAGLKDVAGIDVKLRQLGRSGDVRRVRSMENEIQATQKAAEIEISSLIQTIDSGTNFAFAMKNLQMVLDGLRKDADQKKDESRRIAGVRLLSRFWISFNDETSLAFDQHDYRRAAVRLELMSRIRPDNPLIYYHLARAYSLGGSSEKALEALREAVAKGYKDIESLESSRDLEPLKQNPNYRKIVEGLKNHGRKSETNFDGPPVEKWGVEGPD